MVDSDIKKGAPTDYATVPPNPPPVLSNQNDSSQILTGAVTRNIKKGDLKGAAMVPPEIPQVLSNQNGSNRILTGVVTSKQNPNSSKTSDTNDG